MTSNSVTPDSLLEGSAWGFGADPLPNKVFLPSPRAEAVGGWKSSDLFFLPRSRWNEDHKEQGVCTVAVMHNGGFAQAGERIPLSPMDWGCARAPSFNLSWCGVWHTIFAHKISCPIGAQSPKLLAAGKLGAFGSFFPGGSHKKLQPKPP